MLEPAKSPLSATPAYFNLLVSDKLSLNRQSTSSVLVNGAGDFILDVSSSIFNVVDDMSEIQLS